MQYDENLDLKQMLTNMDTQSLGVSINRIKKAEQNNENAFLQLNSNLKKFQKNVAQAKLNNLRSKIAKDAELLKMFGPEKRRVLVQKKIYIN